jgi:hypothetical protein
METDKTRMARPEIRSRRELASQLLAHVERLPALLGTVPLATEVQLLKRDLSRGHDAMRAAGETSFLSAIALVESALACLTWKQYTPAVVTALREAFTAGVQEGAFTFIDYDAVRRLFTERGIRTVPAIDLDALEPEDLEDGQEG